MNEYGNSYIAC